MADEESVAARLRFDEFDEFGLLLDQVKQSFVPKLL